MLEDIAGWIGPIATAIAAIMTAANLGTRVTGWGFVVFAVGSVCWTTVGLSAGQPNLAWTNAFLTLVNLLGIWRWLGRQARYDANGREAVATSVRAPTATLLTLSTIPDMPVHARGHGRIGTVVEALLERKTGRIAAIIVRRGGIAGIGERLIAVEADRLALHEAHVALDMTTADLDALPDWSPAGASRPGDGHPR